MNSEIPPKYISSLVLVGLLVGYLAGSVGFLPTGKNPADTRNIGHNTIQPSAQRTAIATTKSGPDSSASDDLIRHVREAVSGNTDAGAAGDGNGNIDNVDSAMEAAAAQRATDNLLDTVAVPQTDLDAARNPVISATPTVAEENTESRRLTIAKSPVDATNKDDSASAEAVAPAESPAGNTSRQSITPIHDTSAFTIDVQNGIADPERMDVRVFEAESACEDSFALVTTPRLGFSNQEKTYLLGQPMFNLIRSYGLAEKVSDTFTGINAKLFTEEEYGRAYSADTKTYVYVRRGIHVTSDKRGLIKGALFYVSNGWAGMPASIFTRFGDASRASLEEIIKAYGQPAATRHHDPLGYYDWSMDYEFGGDVLTFSFWRNKLISIGITRDSSYL